MGIRLQGDTPEEILKKPRNAMEVYLKVLAKQGQTISLEFSEVYKVRSLKRKG